jgi:hypothetical protein
MRIRDKLINDLLKLPSDAIVNLRELQAERGCFNQCSFCSVKAGKVVHSLDQNALSNLFAGIKFVGLKIIGLENQLSEDGTFSSNFKMPKGGLASYGQRLKRRGAIYPYVDNNITSYPFIDKYVRYAMEDLGLKTRITTVGNSRLDQELQKANENVNNLYKQYVNALRFSLTPYTYAWASSDSLITSRKEFILDLSNTLKTYKSTVDYLLSTGADTAIEFRFRPLIITENKFEETTISNRHVFHIGPYLLIDACENGQLIKSSINGKIRHSPLLNGYSRKYIMLVSDKISGGNSWRDIAKDIIAAGEPLDYLSQNFLVRRVDMYLLDNEDGVYYSVDPGIKNDGAFEKCFYPKTERRPHSGYIDVERYFMNAILKYKNLEGLGRLSQFKEANFDDVQNVIVYLRNQSAFLEKFDIKAANYIKKDILPLVEGYIHAMRLAGYSASYFFDPRFTINAGNVRNLGRGHKEYKNITSRPEMAVTFEWRIAPFYVHNSSALLVEEQDFSKRTEDNCGVTQRHIVKFEGVRRLTFDEEIRKNEYIIPGLNRIGKTVSQ